MLFPVLVGNDVNPDNFFLKVNTDRLILLISVYFPNFLRWLFLFNSFSTFQILLELEPLLPNLLID